MYKAYYKYRSAGRCEYVELESIKKHRYPHFVTLNGSSYRFERQDEYVLLFLPKFISWTRSSNASCIECYNSDKTVGIVAFVIVYLQGKNRVQFELFPTHLHREIPIDTRLIESPHEEFAVLILIYEDEYVKIK